MQAQRIAIVGIGLIGGSLARALRRAGRPGAIVACDTDAQSLAQALAQGVIDRATADPAEAAAQADLVVLAVGPAQLPAVLAALAPALHPATVVTDVASIKQPVIEAARAALGAAFSRFVPGHPIAGTERSGFPAAFAELFDRQRVILTPVPDTDRGAVDAVRELWLAAGAGEVSEMDPRHHDAALAATSHVPHVLAYALAASIAPVRQERDLLALAGGGFADFTRIAASQPELWRDICLANRAEIVPLLERYAGLVGELAGALRRQDGARLLEVFAQAKRVRDAFVDRRDRR